MNRDLFAPEPQGVRRDLTTTSAGIHIGAHWFRPAPAMSADDERLQAALLRRPRPGRSIDLALVVIVALWSLVLVGLRVF